MPNEKSVIEDIPSLTAIQQSVCMFLAQFPPTILRKHQFLFVLEFVTPFRQLLLESLVLFASGAD